MRLTHFTDFSLRVLMYLAAQPGRRSTIGQIAAAYGVSENHLVKVVHFLGKQRWLHNVRGKGGGLELALPPGQIILGQVVRQTEGTPPIVQCSGEAGHACCIAPICGLRGVLVEALGAFYAVLDGYTLEDLVRNREQLASILFVAPGADLRSAA